MEVIARGGRRLAEPGIKMATSQQAARPRWERSALTFALLAPLPGGLVLLFLLGWLRRRIEAL